MVSKLSVLNVWFPSYQYLMYGFQATHVSVLNLWFPSSQFLMYGSQAISTQCMVSKLWSQCLVSGPQTHHQCVCFTNLNSIFVVKLTWNSVSICKLAVASTTTVTQLKIFASLTFKNLGHEQATSWVWT